MNIQPGLTAIGLLARLDCVLYPFEQIVIQLDALEDEDPELKPELDAVRQHLRDAAESLGRAAKFVHARYQVNEAA